MGFHRSGKFLFLFLLFALLSSSVALAAQSILWTRGRELPQARSNGALGLFRNKLVFIGGNDMEGATDTVQLFDLRRKIWQEGPPMAQPRFAASAVNYKKRVVVLGGYGQNKEVLRTGESFTRRGWKTHPPMLKARARCGAVAVRRAIYVAGGVGADGRDLDSVELYQGGGWSEVPSLLRPRNRLTLVELNNKLIALGGEFEGKATTFCEAYSLKDGSWSEIAPMPRPRKNFAALVFRGKIIVAGGWEMKEGKYKVFHSEVDVYCPKKNEWATVEPMPKGRDGVRAVAWGNRMYFLGGYDGTLTSYMDIGQLVRSADWKVDEEIGFHLATFQGKRKMPKRAGTVIRPKEHPFVALGQPDITNIALKGIRGLGFPLPKLPNEDELTFYLKFYDYPPQLDHLKSTNVQFQDFKLTKVKDFERVMEFVQQRNNVLIKNGHIAKTKSVFDASNHYPDYHIAGKSVGKQGGMQTGQKQFDNEVIFSSLYLLPSGNAPKRGNEMVKICWSALGMLDFYRELLLAYEKELCEVWGEGSEKYRTFVQKLPNGHFIKYSVLREPMVFHNARDLPMPHSSHHFLSSLLLVYRDEYAREGAKEKKRTLLEVGSVVKLP